MASTAQLRPVGWRGWGARARSPCSHTTEDRGWAAPAAATLSSREGGRKRARSVPSSVLFWRADRTFSPMYLPCGTRCGGKLDARSQAKGFSDASREEKELKELREFKTPDIFERWETSLPHALQKKEPERTGLPHGQISSRRPPQSEQKGRPSQVPDGDRGQRDELGRGA